ncbi:hypothetical protein EB796_000388 [Bugula neritina]|uniref:Uncharacterized protein n=1 Tax=Bugula neritina TaxID=10212 RepID=A0A7J7KSZ3_BUGNE|nr:hypothetical protein EB796_000388 [Bugula neritina]
MPSMLNGTVLLMGIVSAHQSSNTLLIMFWQMVKNAWRSKFKQLPPQPERRKTAKSATRRARSAVQPPVSSIVGRL